MRVAIHQPNFLPWLGFFYKASQADVLVFLDDVQFIKRGYIHRNYIKGPNGKQFLGVPVITKGRYDQTINQTEINYDSRWQSKAIQTLKHLYSKSPGYSKRLPIIESILTKHYPYLADLNIDLLNAAFGMMNIETKTIRSSELENITGKSTDRLVSICKSVSAREYLSGAGGKKYQDELAYESAGIQLSYSDFEHPVYTQLHGDFLPQLSIIDYLFNEEHPERIFEKTSIAA